MTKLSRSGDERRVVIGRAGAPHGIHGELRIVPLTDFPERFASLEEVQVGEELLHIVSMKYHKKFILLKFREYPTREEAAGLTGRLLSVARSQAAPLAEGEYYTFDIVGLRVLDGAGNELGQVVNVLRTGSNDVYAVQGEDGREIFVPALKKVVKRIDLENGCMVVDLMEELGKRGGQ